MESEKKSINLGVLVFVFLQVMFIVMIVVTIMRLLSNNRVMEDDEAYYESLPQLDINDLGNKVPDLGENDVEKIQKKLFKIVGENNVDVNANKISFIIRDNKIYKQDFGEYGVSYLSIIVDSPDIRQSYQVFYDPYGVLDPDVAVFVLCLDSDNVIYEDFKCKSSDDLITRSEIAVKYLSYFDFEDLKVVSDNSFGKVTLILPEGKTVQNDGGFYVNKVKEKVRLLGISPEVFEYYPKEYDDVNYDN